MTDGWEDLLCGIEKKYGSKLRNRLDDLIDDNEIPLVILIISKL